MRSILLLLSLACSVAVVFIWLDHALQNFIWHLSNRTECSKQPKNEEVKWAQAIYKWFQNVFISDGKI